VAALSAAALLLQTGCATPSGRATSPPDDATRARLGNVAVIALSTSREISLEIPTSRSEAAGEAATQAGLGWLEHPDPHGAPVYVLWVPFGLVLGGAYGAVAGESKEKIADAVNALTNATAGVAFEERLRDHILAAAGRAAIHPLMTVASPPPEEMASKPYVPDPLRMPDFGLIHAEPRYDSLTNQGIVTVLEIETYSPALQGGAGFNPRLAFSVDVSVRLVAVCGGRELYSDYLQYRGPKRRFVDWAAHQAQPFREELERCLQNLSEEIVRQAFVRRRNDDVDVAPLAALGIARK